MSIYRHHSLIRGHVRYALYIDGWGAAWRAGSLAAERGVMPLRGRMSNRPAACGGWEIQLLQSSYSYIGFARQGGG